MVVESAVASKLPVIYTLYKVSTLTGHASEVVFHSGGIDPIVVVKSTVTPLFASYMYGNTVPANIKLGKFLILHETTDLKQS